MAEENEKKKNGGNDEEKTDSKNSQKDKQQAGEKRTLPVSKIGNHEARYILLGVLGTLLVILVLGTSAFLVRNINHVGFRTNGYGERGIGMMRDRGDFPMMRGRVQSNVLSGKVTAVDGKNFTVDNDGSSVKVAITDATRFPVDSASTVKKDDTVLVWGQKNSSGVVQADRISVNP